MIKTLIAPVQAWLLSQGRCVACGKELAKQKSVQRDKDELRVTCQCRRIFIKDKKTGKYRRARLDEV